jgi:hypothetical protein
MPGSGRKKGTPNKLTMAAKEAFEYAFQDIGGPEALARWARKHQTMFYRLFARLIPLSLKVDSQFTMLSYADERAREQQPEQQPEAAALAPPNTLQ